VIVPEQYPGIVLKILVNLGQNRARDCAKKSTASMVLKQLLAHFLVLFSFWYRQQMLKVPAAADGNCR